MNKLSKTVTIKGKVYDVETGSVVARQNHDGPKHIDGFRAPRKVRKKVSATQIHSSKQKSKRLHPAVAKQAKKKTVAQKSTNETIKSTRTNKKKQLLDKARVQRSTKHTQSSKIQKFSKSSGKNTATAAKVTKATEVPSQTTGVYEVPNLTALGGSPKTSAQPMSLQKPQSRISKLSEKVLRKPRMAMISSLSVLALIFGGYVTYQNIPNMALRLATSRAGFDANLPGYQPSGFNFTGPVSYSPGSVVVNFAAEGGDKSYTISQKESSWDSQSLLENFILKEDKQYVTFQERGLTIYTYDDNNATWVDGGIWYTIEGDATFTSDQLLKIATSL